MPPIYVDLEQTKRRIALLKRYEQKYPLREGEFICKHYNTCAASLPGYHEFRERTMSHVGHRFDLRLSDKPRRVVIVGQESGLTTRIATNASARSAASASASCCARPIGYVNHAAVWATVASVGAFDASLVPIFSAAR